MSIDKNQWNYPNAQTKAKAVTINEREGYLFKEGDRTHVLVLKSNYPSFAPIHTHGLEIMLDNFTLEDDEIIKVLVFKCNQNAFIDSFIEIINTIIEESDNSNLEIKTREVVQRWIRFLGKPLKPRMEENLIIGLIGELLTIQDLVENGVDKETILDSWKGPDHESKDFSFHQYYIETKTSRKEAGHVYKINGVNQLDKDDKTLVLFCYHFIKTDNGNPITLPSLIKKLNSRIFVPLGLEVSFFDKLYEYGFDQRETNNYDRFKYLVNEKKYHLVDESFPKITKVTLGENSDLRISNLSYNIDLNSMAGISIESIANEIR